MFEPVPTLVGIINCCSDSFSDTGHAPSPEQLFLLGRKLIHDDAGTRDSRALTLESRRAMRHLALSRFDSQHTGVQLARLRESLRVSVRKPRRQSLNDHPSDAQPETRRCFEKTKTFPD